MKKLDKVVWKKFIETFQDPAKMQKMILAEDFLIDKDWKSKAILLAKTENDLEKFKRVRRRLNKMFMWGNITDAEYKEQMKGVTNLQK